MISIETSIRQELVVQKIIESICTKAHPTDIRVTANLKDELIGNVDGCKLWIQKTRPYIVKCPQRYFKGQLIEKPNSTEIRGNFQYALSTIVVNIAMTLVLLVISFQKVNNILHNFCWFGIFMLWLMLVIGIIAFRKEEKTVLMFLNSLKGDELIQPDT